MKKILFVLILGVSLLFTGCTSNNLNKLNKNVLKMFYDINYVDKSLSSKEKKLIEKFRAEQNPDNLVIELNDYIVEHLKTSANNTYGVWSENGKYYIKYKDIDFVDLTNDLDDDTGYDYLAIINCNGYEIEFSKDMYPVLYYDTKDLSKYNYSFMRQEELENEIDVHYISYYDNSGLTIRYIKNGNKIEKIELKYLPYVNYDVEEVENDGGKSVIVVSLVTFGIGLALVVSYAIKKIKSSRIM